MGASAAKIRASAKYNSKSYKRFALNTRLEYVPAIEKYMQEHGFTSYSSFFNQAMKYVIENNVNLKPTDE